MLTFLINRTLKPPRGQICQRGRPADIIVQAVAITAKAVMAAINIQSVIKDTGFSVRDILIAGQIGIKNRFHLYALSNVYSPAVSSCGFRPGRVTAAVQLAGMVMVKAKPFSIFFHALFTQP